MNSKPLRLATCVVAIAAVLPYLTLKVLWLAHSSAGATNTAGAAELVDTRHLVGDAITAGMEVVAVTLVLAMTFRWGRSLPAFLVLTPVWVGTGLLTPIALGLPLGVVAQAVVGGSPVPGGNGLQGWVYSVVYGGFVVQAVALVVAFTGYARRRWPGLFRMRLRELRAAAPRMRRYVPAAVALAVGYAGVLVAWSVGGGALNAPGGFETVAQRAFLAGEGVAVLLGVAGVMALLRGGGDRRVRVPLALAWTGTGVTVLSGPAHMALSNHGVVSPLLLTVSLTATLTGLVLVASTLRTLRVT